ncbi:MAG TPA: hypothetical protein VMA34_14310 [Terracidiphilus sp.]|nr:hypothetical protein [Terracidiphilus sp.]
MAVSRPLRRLLRVLDLEEEQRKLALESALASLRQLEHALVAAVQRERGGRGLVTASAATGKLADRLAGLEEARAALRRAAALTPRIADAEEDAADRREEYLAKRVERRQAETLVEESEKRDAAEAARRSQQGLDDWYLNRFRGATVPSNSGDSDHAAAPSSGARPASAKPEDKLT